MTDPATDPPRASDPTYTGESGPIFSLGFRTAVLTLITFGIYRFWAKTRIRRYIWSSTALDGTRFEYTGTGLEKLLGFLVAVVFLAVYLGLVQIVLTFAGLSLVGEPNTPGEAMAQGAAFSLTFLALLPFIFFAQYRARRYKLARTRWRGIRFGMDKAAWGYAWRAIGYYALALLTLGLLMPLATYRLTKYMTDRSWFGNAKFKLRGRWTGLYRAMRHVLIPVFGLIAGSVLAGFLDQDWLIAVLPPAFVIWLIIGVVNYNVQSFAYTTSHTTLENGVSLDSRPQTGTVIFKYVIGSIAISLLLGIFVAVFGGIFAVLFSGLFQMLEADGPASWQAMIAPALVGVLGYLAVILAAGALSLALVVQPILAHYIATLRVENVAALEAIRQRAADEGADAEGFADALDVGGAI